MIELKECVEILDSKRIPLSSSERKRLKKIYPYYGAQGIIDYVENYIFDGEYILIAEDGNNLKSLQQNIATWVEGKFWVNNHAHILGKKKWYNLRYIYYLLSILDLRGYITGSAQPKLNQENLAGIQLQLPNINRQNKVAQILSCIDNKIEINNKINSELEVMAKTIYDYWFLQFEFPNEKGKPYKSSGGKMVWNEEVKREIPDGWKVKKVEETCTTLLGGTPNTKKEDFWNGNIPWLSSGELESSLVLQSEKKITELGKENSATAFAPKGSVLLSITRYIRPAILGIDACFNQSVVAIIPNEQYHTAFLYPFLLSQVDRYMSLRTGAQQPHINKEIIDKTHIICVPDKVLKKYYEATEIIYDIWLNLEKENDELTSLRNFLLPLLMNGQVSFKE